MTGMASLVVFRSSTNGLDEPSTDESGSALAPSVDYLRARERAERAAAKRARSLAARHVHQELAQHYAKLVRHTG